MATFSDTTTDTLVTEAGGVANGTPGDINANGTLTITDPGTGLGVFTGTSPVNATYGVFTFDLGTGDWTYTLDDTRVATDSLPGGAPATDTLTVTSDDGTTFDITVNITGSNDTAMVTTSGSEDNAVVEAGGIANGTAGDASASGQLFVADADTGESNFVTNGTITGTYGDFTFNGATGVWSYTLDDTRPATEALTAGQPVTDTLTVSTTDGTNYNVVVNVTGSNDAAIVTTSGSEDNAVVEAGGVANGTAGDASAGGQLFVSDVDTGENAFVTDGVVGGTYGDFTFNGATGVWTYTLDDTRAATQSLAVGAPGTDTLTVTTIDGTTHNVDVNVTGANDTPALAVIATTTYTDTAADDSFTDIVGTLTPTDPDAGETLSYTIVEGGPDTSLAGYDQSVGTGYGTLYLNGTTGDYTFVADDAGIEGLTGNTSGTFHFQVTDSQGASSIQSIQIDFVGAQDAAIVGGAVTGGVTEDAAATLTVTDLLTVADRDTGESTFQVQSGTAGDNGHGSFDLAADGSWTYTADNTQAAIQQLPDGATLTDSFTAVTADGTTQLVTVTITGVNDAAVIGGVIGGGASEDDAATLTASGALTISDVDTGEASFQAQVGTAGSYGSFDLDAAGNWSYSADNSQAAIQQLSAGETATDSFTALAADGTSQLVTVTITGVNDGPVATDDAIGTTETAPVQVDVLANDSDVDHLDVLTVTGATVTSGLGNVTIASDGSSITYDPAGNYDYLSSGDTVDVTISYTIDDGQGGTATANAVVTVTGGNDAPVIVDPTDSLAVLTELADGDPQENAFTHGVSGTISFTDSDGTDTHTASVTPQDAGYLGTFSISPTVNDVDGNLGWSFSVDDSALNTLGQGQVLRQYYDVTLDDGHGGTVVQTVEVDLVGRNDAAVLSSANVVVQQGNDPATASGVLTITDEDGAAEFVAQTNAAGQYGHLTVATDGHWSFVADSAYASLAPNQYLTDTFTVVAADGTPTTVSVTIAGVDQPAVAQQDLFFTDEQTAIGAGLSLFADNGNGADTDPDSALQISAVEGSAANVGHQVMLDSGALVIVNADGTFHYDPNHAFDSLTAAQGAGNQSTFDSFTYTLAGGSTTTVFVNVAGVNSVQDIVAGNGLDNAVTGFSGADTFLMNQAGDDSVHAMGGNDGVYFGGYFNSADQVDGGAGNDTLALQGDTNASLAGVSNVEVLLAMSGSDTSLGGNGTGHFSYDLTSADSTVAAGQTLTVIGTGLQSGENLHFDGSAETDGNFRIFGGQGDDDLSGGAGSDGFFFGADGNLNGADHVDGGAGIDTLALRGDYGGANAIVFQDGSVSNVEVMALLSGHTNEYSGVIVPNGYDYDVTLADGNVAAGDRLDVNGSLLGADETLVFDGSAETDGSFRVISGAGDDTIIGGAGNDILYGGLGADHLDGGAGADIFTYRSAAESTSTGYDVISGFDYREDVLDLPGGGARAFTQAGHGTLSTASFDADLGAALDGVLGAGQAALFTADAGTLSGHVFAVVDANGVAGYQAGADFVIELANPAVAIDPHAVVIG